MRSSLVQPASQPASQPARLPRQWITRQNFGVPVFKECYQISRQWRLSKKLVSRTTVGGLPVQQDARRRFIYPGSMHHLLLTVHLLKCRTEMANNSPVGVCGQAGQRPRPVLGFELVPVMARDSTDQKELITGLRQHLYGYPHSRSYTNFQPTT
jgi:hypothetical protein